MTATICIEIPRASSKAFPSLVNLLHSLLKRCILVVCLDDICSLLCGRVHRTNNISTHIVGEHARICHAQIVDTLDAQSAVKGAANGATANGVILRKDPVSFQTD
jgi:hypothetical protein